MNEELTISRSRLMAFWVAIVVLLILVIFLYLRAQPPLSENLKGFLDNVNKETTSLIAIIDKNAHLTIFNQDFSPAKPCGESDATIVPPSCGLEGSGFLKQSPVAVMVVCPSRDSTVISTRGMCYTDYCPNGQRPPCRP